MTDETMTDETKYWWDGLLGGIGIGIFVAIIFGYYAFGAGKEVGEQQLLGNVPKYACLKLGGIWKKEEKKSWSCYIITDKHMKDDNNNGKIR